MSRTSLARFVSGLKYALLCAVLTFTGGLASAQSVSQVPLSVPNVPGNLVLVPSVEWPTLDSMANLGDYTTNRRYVGYFDPGKCYKYSFHATDETQRHFYPERTTTTRTCTRTNGEWSGNYLNWATTQTIDPFRKALTGGYRVRDEVNETWLEKARYDGNGGNDIFPNRRLPAAGANRALVTGATPADWDDITIRIWQLGNRMRFTRSGSLNGTAVVAYNPNVHTSPNSATIYEVSVRVKVCVTGMIEENCKPYGANYKPEGLIQQYSERLRYSVFGYLNDGSVTRDGGVLRARQKFVGDKKKEPDATWGWLKVPNDNREWNATTGVLIPNPDSDDASATSLAVGQTIGYSGVINYINRFGQMTTANHKNYDPVSEMFYAAIRYLKNQANIDEYTNLTGTSAEKFTLADGFPVIANWRDPIQYRCQKNALLGIGDTNTWYDKNLPGNTVRTNEPTAPEEVTSDTTVNVVTATEKVAQLEGIPINTPFNAGRASSAYMAGLAYDSHTRDMRPDLRDDTGTQTVSTYWVDVREAQRLAARASNQYWLAAKYGGFDVPENFNPYAVTTTTLNPQWWDSNDVLSTGDPRPNNFYVASEADTMVQSLTRAFARIAGSATGSGSALASSSSRLEDAPMLFQATFKAGVWSGELKSYAVSDRGVVAPTPSWNAAAQLNTASWADRNIYTYVPGVGYSEFNWDDLSTAQQAALGDSEAVFNYLRGDRSREVGQTNGTLRTRTFVLGDIVNSSPVYVGKPNGRLHVGATFRGASDYPTFVTNQANRTAAVYVGANDGMLHGFNASTGAELYAYVPNAAINANLLSYTNPAYEHRYFVDGEIAVADVYIRNPTGSGSSWKTVLVGTMGRGGPGVFALDVTDPSDVKFLWEKNGTDIPGLGKILGRPVITQVADGEWRVLLGNGPVGAADVTTATAKLVIIDLEDGSNVTVDTGATGNNGLAPVLARSNDGDAFADTAYAGDMLGNLWKFTDLDDSTPSYSKMFEAESPNGAAQPITAAPNAARDPDTGIVWVYFGTGRYLAEEDTRDLQVQTWYGIKDTGEAATRGDLVGREIFEQGSGTRFALRRIAQGTAAELVDRDGWFINLDAPPNDTAQGERIVLQPRFLGDVLTVTTRIPNPADACLPSGRSWIYAINPFTGGRLDRTFFDATGDNEFTDADLLNGGIVSGVLIDPGLGGNGVAGDDQLYFGDEVGGQGRIRFQGGANEAGRLSWRELVK